MAQAQVAELLQLGAAVHVAGGVVGAADEDGLGTGRNLLLEGSNGRQGKIIFQVRSHRHHVRARSHGKTRIRPVKWLGHDELVAGIEAGHQGKGNSLAAPGRHDNILGLNSQAQLLIIRRQRLAVAAETGRGAVFQHPDVGLLHCRQHSGGRFDIGLADVERMHREPALAGGIGKRREFAVRGRRQGHPTLRKLQHGFKDRPAPAEPQHKTRKKLFLRGSWQPWCHPPGYIGMPTPAQPPQPEVWLRGPLPGVPPLLQPLAHALLQARAEVQAALANFPDDLLEVRPAGVASVGFHLRHLSGVLDRMQTYARHEPLSKLQFAYLSAEKDGLTPPDTTAGLVQQFQEAVEQMLVTLRATPEAMLSEFRPVGRQALPSTVMGLLTHAAEHTTRHVGQLLVTARVAQARG